VAKKLRIEREARGEESGMYAYLQPQEMPTLDELVGERIDVCWPYVVGNNKKRSEQEYEYRWCQGKVIEKVSKAPPTVKVLWAMPDLRRKAVPATKCCNQASGRRRANLGGEWTLM
jgi:hypothetical protein